MLVSRIQNNYYYNKPVSKCTPHFEGNPFRKIHIRPEVDKVTLRKNNSNPKSIEKLYRFLKFINDMQPGLIIRDEKISSKVKTLLEIKFPFFKGLKNEPEVSFTQKAYDEMVEFMELKGVAPKKIETGEEVAEALNLKGNSADAWRELKAGNENICIVGYNYQFGRIVCDPLFPTLDKYQKLYIIAHELLHCKQHVAIIRTEGLGTKALANNIARGNVSIVLKSGNKIAQAYILQMLKKGMTADEILRKIVNNATVSIEKDLNGIHANALELPKFKKNSKEGRQAKKYFNAVKVYERWNPVNQKKYRSNRLEKEAYPYGEAVSGLFKIYSALK